MHTQNLYTNIRGGIIHNRQRVETPECLATGEWIKKWSGILLNNKKEWNSNMFYNMDETWTHNAKWKNTFIWNGQNNDCQVLEVVGNGSDC